MSLLSPIRCGPSGGDGREVGTGWGGTGRGPPVPSRHTQLLQFQSGKIFFTIIIVIINARRLAKYLIIGWVEAKINKLIDM